MSNRNKILVTIAMMTGMLVAALDQTIVDTAFPRMISELGGVSLFSWVITAYMLASTSIVPVVGKLADLYGRKLFWNLGIVIFVGGSVLCGTATTMGQLIAYRAIQGIGGGMIMPVTQTIIGDIYSGEQRAKMQGVFSGVFALGSAIGPLLGGYIVDHYHWKYIFLLNLPTGALALVMAAIALKGMNGVAQQRRIDWMGSFLSVGGVSSLLLALQTGGDKWAWSSWQILGLFGASILLLVLFVFNELRVAEPILDLRLFQNRTFATFNAVAFVLGLGMFGAVVFVPWFMQGVLGVTATSSGLVMLPMTLSMVVGSILGGQLARRIAYRWQIFGGLVLVATGFWFATGYTMDTTLWHARSTMMISGFGVGLVMPLITLGVQQAFDRSRRAVVTSATSFFRSVGGTVGVTVLSVVFNKQMTHQYDRLMAPQIKLLPAPLAAKFAAIAEKPADLVQVLLQKSLQELIPQQIRPQTLGLIKQMMVDSLHPVFWVSLSIVLVGGLIGFFLGKESLTAQIRRQAESGASDDSSVIAVGH